VRLDHLLSKEPFGVYEVFLRSSSVLKEQAARFELSGIHLSGDDCGGVPRVPIPNTTVKPSSANGTWTAGSWESRTSPGRPFCSVFGGAEEANSQISWRYYGPLAQLVRAHP
jgi:hypothetical protein